MVETGASSAGAFQKNTTKTRGGAERADLEPLKGLVFGLRLGLGLGLGSG